MADMKHLPNVSYVNGCVRVKLDLSRYGKNLERAQYLFGNMVLQDCKPFMPLLTGNFQQRSYVDEGGRSVVFPGPYGRYLYMGKAMKNAATGKGPRKIPTGPGEYIWRWPKGAKLVPTDRPLKYSRPEAQARWFEVAKAQNQGVWVDKLKGWILNGGGSGV